MSQREIDEYLAALDEPKRSTLEELRRAILDVIPEADQGISYGMPAFKVDGKVVAGFAAFKNHLSYFPHSGSVLPELADDLSGYAAIEGNAAVRRRRAAAEGPRGEARRRATPPAPDVALGLLLGYFQMPTTGWALTLLPVGLAP